MNLFSMNQLWKIRQISNKVIDNSNLCDKIQWICKDNAEIKRILKPSARGVRCKPSAEMPQATSCVAREDRDGCSRYRVSKMSAMRMN